MPPTKSGPSDKSLWLLVIADAHNGAESAKQAWEDARKKRDDLIREAVRSKVATQVEIQRGTGMPKQTVSGIAKATEL